MAKLRYTPKFAKDLTEIAEYIEKDSQILSKEFVHKVLQRPQLLETNSLVGRIVPEKANPNLREIFFLGNYRMVYRLKNEIIEVLMIRHAARLR